MTRNWRRRIDWPAVMDKQEMLECVPGMTNDLAEEILRTYGTMSDGIPVISRVKLIAFLDGDMTWETATVGDRLTEVVNRGGGYQAPAAMFCRGDE